MVWKQSTNTSSVGTAAKFGAADINKYSKYLGGEADVEPADIDTSTTIRSGKLKLRNPLNTFSYSFVASAIAAARALTLPLLTSDDTIAVLALSQTFSNKTLDSSCVVDSASLPAAAVTLTGVQTLTNKTLTGPIISVISNTGAITLPTTTDTLVGRDTTDTLTNKTLTLPIISAVSNSGTITFPTGTLTLASLTGTENLTNKTLDSTNTISSATSLPTVTIAKGGTGQATATAGFDALSPMTTAGDVIIGGASGTRTRLGIGTANQLLRVNAGATAPEYANTLSGLTLTAPVISTISNTGTITLPTSTDTLVGKATTDTLTNKTLTTPTLTGPTIDRITHGDVGIDFSNSPYTITATKTVIRVDASAGSPSANTILTLPTAVGIAGVKYTIKRTDIIASSFLAQINTTSSQTIDGAAAHYLWPAEFVEVESDGANWFVTNRSQPSANLYYLNKGSSNNRRYIAGNMGINGAFVASTTAPAINTLFALPFIVPKTTKFDLIGFTITTLLNPSNARAGIYRDNGNNYPGALIFDTTSISCATTGDKSTTITAGLQVFPIGLYWLAWECDATPIQLHVLNGANHCYAINGSVVGSATNSFAYSVAHTFGALPDPFTAGATLNNGTPSATSPFAAINLRPI